MGNSFKRFSCENVNICCVVISEFPVFAAGLSSLGLRFSKKKKFGHFFANLQLKGDPGA